MLTYHNFWIDTFLAFRVLPESNNILIFLYFISLAMVVNSLAVILSNHPIFSLLFLIANFILAAILLFLLECEFLALLFIVVYVGAVAILFLFAIMMLESKLNDLSRNSTKYITMGPIYGFFLLVPVLNNIFVHFQNNYDSKSFHLNIYQNWYDLADSVNDVEVYGEVLYSYYVFQFLISGLLLLLVLIGVVYLTNIFTTKHNMNQVLFKQLSRHSKFC
jgi:NADH-quinone oxidoreductase subunit J